MTERLTAALITSTSVTADKGHETPIDHASTKGAIVALTRSLSQVPEDKGIKPNVAAPSYVFPAGEDASDMSGQVLHPDGGRILGS